MQQMVGSALADISIIQERDSVQDAVVQGHNRKLGEAAASPFVIARALAPVAIRSLQHSKSAPATVDALLLYSLQRYGLQ